MFLNNTRIDIIRSDNKKCHCSVFVRSVFCFCM